MYSTKETQEHGTQSRAGKQLIKMLHIIKVIVIWETEMDSKFSCLYPAAKRKRLWLWGLFIICWHNIIQCSRVSHYEPFKPTHLRNWLYFALRCLLEFCSQWISESFFKLLSFVLLTECISLLVVQDFMCAWKQARIGIHLLLKELMLLLWASPPPLFMGTWIYLLCWLFWIAQPLRSCKLT